MTEQEEKARQKLRREALLQDYREVLSTEAGRRVLGALFFIGNIFGAEFNSSSEGAAYMQGQRAAVMSVVNVLREIDPRLVGECEIAYREFERRFGDADGDGE